MRTVREGYDYRDDLLCTMKKDEIHLFPERFRLEVENLNDSLKLAETSKKLFDLNTPSLKGFSLRTRG